jgi:hypothetical protein
MTGLGVRVGGTTSAVALGVGERTDGAVVRVPVEVAVAVAVAVAVGGIGVAVIAGRIGVSVGGGARVAAGVAVSMGVTVAVGGAGLVVLTTAARLVGSGSGMAVAVGPAEGRASGIVQPL